jgi:hypothetical protein
MSIENFIVGYLTQQVVRVRRHGMAAVGAELFGVTLMHMHQGEKKNLALFMGLIGKCIRLNLKKCIMEEQFQLVAKLQG